MTGGGAVRTVAGVPVADFFASGAAEEELAATPFACPAAVGWGPVVSDDAEVMIEDRVPTRATS